MEGRKQSDQRWHRRQREEETQRLEVAKEAEEAERAEIIAATHLIQLRIPSEIEIIENFFKIGYFASHFKSAKSVPKHCLVQVHLTRHGLNTPAVRMVTHPHHSAR